MANTDKHLPQPPPGWHYYAAQVSLKNLSIDHKSHRTLNILVEISCYHASQYE